MRTVITVSLNGTAYQLETAACAALDAYLKLAERRLGANPDRAEILTDLEQAVAEKCNRHLGAHKNVVTAVEMADILKEMGPVEGDAADPAGKGGSASGEGGSAGGGGGAGGGSAGADDPAFSGNSHATGAPLGDAGPGAQTAEDAAGAKTGAFTASGAPGTASGAQGTATGPGAPGPRPFYRIREGQAIAGVCTGIAAWTGWHVSIVRAVLIILSVITWGFLLLPYLAVAMVVPYAETPQQQAAAHGQPFSAEDVIRRARAQYEAFQQRGGFGTDWRAQRRAWREQRRQWRAQQRAWRLSMRWNGAPGPGQWPPPPPYPATVLGALLSPALGLISALLGIGFVVLLLLIVTHHRTHWLPWAAGIPWWVGIIVLCMVYGMVMSVVGTAHHAVRGLPYGNAGAALIGSAIWLCLLAAGAWYAWQHWPEVVSFLQQLGHGLQQLLPPPDSVPSGSAWRQV